MRHVGDSVSMETVCEEMQGLKTWEILTFLNTHKFRCHTSIPLCYRDILPVAKTRVLSL